MKQRVITALLLIPPVLAALFAASPWPIAILGLVAILLGALEIQKMLDSDYVLMGAIAFTAVAVMSANGVEMPKISATGLALLSAVGYLSSAWEVRAKANRKRRVINLTPAGWIVGPILALLCLHNLGASGSTGMWKFATPVLLAIVPLWGGDTAAIFAGKAFGKHPLAPKISPKKTWEGSIANLLACILVAVPLAIWIGYSWPIGIACGLIAGILGQAGDLFESYVKRAAGLKDSGTLLPGHGGIMDRIDSILFTAPAVALLLTLVS